MHVPKAPHFCEARGVKGIEVHLVLCEGTALDLPFALALESLGHTDAHRNERWQELGAVSGDRVGVDEEGPGGLIPLDDEEPDGNSRVVEDEPMLVQHRVGVDQVGAYGFTAGLCGSQHAGVRRRDDRVGEIDVGAVEVVVDLDELKWTRDVSGGQHPASVDVSGGGECRNATHEVRREPTGVLRL